MHPMVVVPTYNERENIDALLETLLRCHDDLEIIVVDDHSPDGTGEMVDRWVSTESRVHVVHRSGKLGLGTAYIAGFEYALAHDADYILTMDADFSHHPRFIPALLAAIQDADLVIGSRYVRGGGTSNCPVRRKLLSRGANALAKTLLGLHAKDCTAGFRCYRAEVLHTIPFKSIRSNGYSYLIDMLFAVQRRHFVVTEIPIIFEDRQYGVSKISSNEINRAIQTVLRLSKERLVSKLIAPRQHPATNDNLPVQEAKHSSRVG